MGSPAKPLATHDAPSNDAVRAPHDDPAQVVFAAVHEPTLTATEVTFLNSLTERVAADERTRFDMAQMLGDDETLAALHTYRALFDTAGIDVDPALHTLPHALRLERLERRLALAQSLVHRHLVATMSPLASLSSDLHRLVVGTPDGSTLRAAFAAFEERWADTFARGPRAPKAATVATDPTTR